VSEVAFELQISEQNIYSWLWQDRIERGLEDGGATPMFGSSFGRLPVVGR
jgi:hypothetical protein